jgi:ABC-type uncharacterized transport system substrate-binding protein
MSVRLAVALLFAGVVSVVAQEVVVPVEVQVVLLCKVLAFDRALASRPGGEIVVGVVYQSRYRASVEVKEEFLRTATSLGEQHIAGLRVRFVPVELDDATHLAQQLTGLGLDALYVCPLRAVEVSAVSQATRKAQVVSFTGLPSYVHEGLAVGFGVQGDKPQLVVNLKAARAEGADFDARLLKLSRVLE